MFPSVATYAYTLDVGKTLIDISDVSYKLRVTFPTHLRDKFDVAAWVNEMIAQTAEVHPYPLSLNRDFVKSS